MQENEAWISKKELIIPIISIIVFLLLVGSASYAYYTQSVGSATGAANISNANLTVPRGCTFIANATNCVITANNATTTAFTDSVITRAEMSQTYAGNSVAKATCTLNIGVQGTAGCKCNYTVSLAGSEPIDYLYDSMRISINKNSTAVSLLPSEYQQVEYIETTGTQYINTNFTPNSNTSIEVKVLSNSTVNSALYCSRTSMNSNTYTAFLISGNQLRVDYNTGQNTIATYDKGIPHIFKQDKNVIYVDGALVQTLAAATFSTSYKLTLLASHQAQSGYSNIGNPVRLYYAKIWDNGTLERVMVPCYRKSDSVIGMYDLVHGVFYTNAGSGVFNKGSNITSGEFDVSLSYKDSGTISVATTGTAVYTNYSLTLEAYNTDFGQNVLASKGFVYSLKATPTCTVA
jgi:hypothetical protein